VQPVCVEDPRRKFLVDKAGGKDKLLSYLARRIRWPIRGN
jgi:hypothetical protein